MSFRGGDRGRGRGGGFASRGTRKIQGSGPPTNLRSLRFTKAAAITETFSQDHLQRSLVRAKSSLLSFHWALQELSLQKWEHSCTHPPVTWSTSLRIRKSPISTQTSSSKTKQRLERSTRSLAPSTRSTSPSSRKKASLRSHSSPAIRFSSAATSFSP